MLKYGLFNRYIIDILTIIIIKYSNSYSIFWFFNSNNLLKKFIKKTQIFLIEKSKINLFIKWHKNLRNDYYKVFI